jgi:uncharacterized protein (TIGR03435 family)
MVTGVIAKTAGLLALVSMAVLSGEQSQPGEVGDRASFEVASVKPNNSGSLSSALPFYPNGGFNASNVSLKSVIAIAYEVRVFQIEGGPDWLNSARFDITARGREGTPDRLRPAMMRTLLAERFKLVAHFEERQQPLYALTVPSSDGHRGGPNLKPSPPPQSDAKPGTLFTSVRNGVGRIEGTRMTIDTLASVLSGQVLTRRVVNRTALSGEFDVNLQFTVDTVTRADQAPQFPSLVTALQEQLGLKLQSERGPVPVLVIDSVQQPTPN